MPIDPMKCSTSRLCTRVRLWGKSLPNFANLRDRLKNTCRGRLWPGRARLLREVLQDRLKGKVASGIISRKSSRDPAHRTRKANNERLAQPHPHRQLSENHEYLNLNWIMKTHNLRAPDLDLNPSDTTNPINLVLPQATSQICQSVPRGLRMVSPRGLYTAVCSIPQRLPFKAIHGRNIQTFGNLTWRKAVNQTRLQIPVSRSGWDSYLMRKYARWMSMMMVRRSGCGCGRSCLWYSRAWNLRYQDLQDLYIYREDVS